MPEIVAEYVDRLVTVEIRNRGIPAGVTHRLYDAARTEADRRPLTLRAAEGLVRSVRPGSNVFIITGAGGPPLLPKGENDGPVGAAVLGRILHRGIGATPIYLVDRDQVDPLVASNEAGGVRIVDYRTAKEHNLGGVILSAPNGGSVADWATSLFETYQPASVMSVERLGPNEKGVTHGATGIRHDGLADLSPVITEASRRGVFSVGIGDHGNELGFGRIHSAVKQIHPAGAMCRCDCGAGMATVVKTDALVVAAISNWGAYGVEAMLAFLLRRADLVHPPEMSRRMIYACLDAGGYESRFCTKLFVVDEADGESSISVVQLLGDMVRSALATPEPGPAH
jgi:D-glutamate cyclase